MATKEELVSVIKEWIANDTEIKNLQTELRNKKKNSKILTENLVNIMKSNELNCIDINNGKLIHKVSKTKKPINKQSLLHLLSNYFNDAEQATKISSYILDNREPVIREYIHRKIIN